MNANLIRVEDETVDLRAFSQASRDQSRLCWPPLKDVHIENNERFEPLEIENQVAYKYLNTE